MEEGEYKSAYRELTAVRCVFEKALTHQQATCVMAKHFWLADREGYACKSEEASIICRELLENLRKNSKFALKLQDTDAPLPHNMDIRVQVGGLRGLRVLQEAQVPGQVEGQVAGATDESPVSNIRQLLETVLARYGSIQALPFSDIMQQVTQYRGRQRRQPR